ncbi:flagellar hook-associated protein FlgK [Methylocella sp.]|uniref:flagellar hook-associated protein FlgK n=1 Tax=Methylocella sp. TaxID=1978226 RepID=UPI0037839E00
MSLSTAASATQSGLAAVTTGIATLSRNISGASDTSYFSRKTANVVSTGYGSQVTSITRVSAQAVFEKLLSSTAASAGQDALTAGLKRLSQTLGDVSSDSDSANSPSALISALSTALQTYEGSPSDASAAAGVVSAAVTLAQGLNQAAAETQQVRQDADDQIAADVASVNNLLGKLEPLNARIMSGLAASRDVTDLEDQRDEIVKQLSAKIGVTTSVAGDGDMSVYTDSGVVLFQGGRARTVAFEATQSYTASTVGKAVYVDGVAVTGASSPMPLATGEIAGLASLRDLDAPTYQAQLDGMALALVQTFKESAQSGAGPDLPGLFTTSGASAMPTSASGLAAQIVVNPAVDPSQGGNAFLLRDGGIADGGAGAYDYNTTGAASFAARLVELQGKLAGAQSFSSAGGLSTSATLGAYASASASWIESKYASAADASSYQDAVASAASTALSNDTGVNINDEMSKMLDLEQSFSASAKMLSAINDMFNALLNGI